MTDREADTSPPPSRDRRWDDDARGEGIADARSLAPRIDALRAAAEAPSWVAEEPEAHLWPHLERAIGAAGSPWRSARHSTDDSGRLVVDLVLDRVDDDRLRAAILSETMRLLGFVLEGATYVQVDEQRAEGVLIVDVVTGMLDDQTPFKGHGHTLRFRVTNAPRG